MNSFTKKFIIRSIIVISVMFLAIYFLFNQVADDFIINSAESELTVRISNPFAENIAISDDEGWHLLPIETAASEFLDLPYESTTLDSIALAIFSDTSIQNYVIINDRGEMATSEHVLTGNLELLPHDNYLVDQHVFLANYYLENRVLFEIGNMVTVHLGNRTFYLRSIATDYVDDWPFPSPPIPLTILLYTDVTEMLALKNTVNQILLVALSLSGIIILAVTVRMSSRFKQSIKKLANYAKEIGHGSFNAEIEPLRYAEFQTLANSMTDMSNMLATYEANQKQFFQNASHELRTPLMSIQCYSEGILADVFEPNEAAIIIKNEIEKMTELVSSILYLSRIDYHTTQIEPVNINEFLANCRDQIKILTDNNDKIICFNPMKQDLQVGIDYQLFERAILNILTNALRYAKKEIRITLEKRLNRDIFTNVKQDRILIKIANDGEKVSQKDLPHLFERFYKGSGGNTGLGLAITKEIVSHLGGHVSAKNLDEGVCFTIELPLYEQNTLD